MRDEGQIRSICNTLAKSEVKSEFHEGVCFGLNIALGNDKEGNKIEVEECSRIINIWDSMNRLDSNGYPKPKK